MYNAKLEVEKMLHNLSDDTDEERRAYSDYVREKVRKGLEAAENGGGLTHEEVKERLKKWLKN